MNKKTNNDVALGQVEAEKAKFRDELKGKQIEKEKKSREDKNRQLIKVEAYLTNLKCTWLREFLSTEDMTNLQFRFVIPKHTPVFLVLNPTHLKVTTCWGVDTGEQGLTEYASLGEALLKAEERYNLAAK